MEEESLWELLDSEPPEHQVIKITGDLYDELITTRVGGSPQNSVPWVLVFVKPETVDDKRAYQQYRGLAKRYKGKVRFGFVVAREEELLAATFDARFLPQTFYIKDGTAYWYRDFPYESHLGHYIDTEHQGNSTTSFAQPRRFYPPQLYLYAYPRKDIRNYYRQHLEWELRVWLDYLFPNSGNLMPKLANVVDAIYWTLVWLILAGPSCFYLIFCRCLGCCGRGKKAGAAKAAPSYHSSSAADVLKKD